VRLREIRLPRGPAYSRRPHAQGDDLLLIDRRRRRRLTSRPTPLQPAWTTHRPRDGLEARSQAVERDFPLMGRHPDRSVGSVAPPAPARHRNPPARAGLLARMFVVRTRTPTHSRNDPACVAGRINQELSSCRLIVEKAELAALAHVGDASNWAPNSRCSECHAEGTTESRPPPMMLAGDLGPDWNPLRLTGAQRILAGEGAGCKPEPIARRPTSSSQRNTSPLTDIERLIGAAASVVAAIPMAGQPYHLASFMSVRPFHALQILKQNGLPQPGPAESSHRLQSVTPMFMALPTRKP